MLKILARNIDIYQISKVLGKRRLKASITESEIIIESDEITNDVANSIFENATVTSIQNYFEDSETSIDEETNSKHDDESINTIPIKGEETICESESKAQCNETIENLPPKDGKINDSNITKNQEDAIFETVGKTANQMYEELKKDETIDSEYYIKDSSEIFEDLNIKTHIDEKSTKIPKSEMVYRGEVYEWEVYEDKSEEKTIKECVIIIQNDYQNSVSDDTIALFCTSHYDERAPINFFFQLNRNTMIDYSTKRLEVFNNCNLFVGRIKGISRKKLGKYLGTMNAEFMNTLQPSIDFCLGLKRSRTVNWAQLQILSTVKMEELFRIAESKANNDEKVEEFLKLFGFDMNCNGVEYVKEAILIAWKLSDYKLETLAIIIAKNKDIQPNKVLKLIIARIKEKFNYEKSLAISFIRLVERLLKKG